MADAITSEAERQAQRVVNAYGRAFDGEDGKLILGDLETSFGLDQPAFLPLANRGGAPTYDPIHAAIRDGQRQVILHIRRILNLPKKGDGN